MTIQVRDHLVGPLELLNETHVLICTREALPSHEASPDSLQVVVLAESNSELLSANEVTKEVLTLEGKCVD